MVDRVGEAHRTSEPESLVGSFEWDLGLRQWSWSDEVFEIHGFAPHMVVPTTELLLAHEHPDDRGRVQAALRRALRTGAVFSCLHRIIDAMGRERVVVLIGQGHRTLGAERPRVTGYLAEVTTGVQERASVAATESITASARHRASIEQAVGIIAFCERLDVAEAFGVLRAVSNRTNVPIRLLAQVIIEAVPDLGGDARRFTRLLQELSEPRAHRHP